MFKWIEHTGGEVRMVDGMAGEGPDHPARMLLGRAACRSG